MSRIANASCQSPHAKMLGIGLKRKSKWKWTHCMLVSYSPSLRPVAFALQFAVLQARAGASSAVRGQSVQAAPKRASALPWSGRASVSHTFQVCMATATAEL